MNSNTNNKICLNTHILVSISLVYIQIYLYQVFKKNSYYCIIKIPTHIIVCITYYNYLYICICYK